MMTTTKAVAPMSRQCRERIDQMFEWIDGELTSAQAGAIERHLETCDCCGGLAEDLRRAIAACRMAGDCRTPLTVRRRARARARQIMRRG